MIVGCGGMTSGRYVEPPHTYTGTAPSIFLAGGISGCVDWQAVARELLADTPAVLLNPRRAHFPIDDPAAAPEQIAWEYQHLRWATVVLFWFAPGPSVQPIALYELGAQAAIQVPVKPMAVGADPTYPRRLDVVLQLGHARPDLTVYETLADTCTEAQRLLREVTA